MKTVRPDTTVTLRHPFMKTPRQKISARILVGSVAALLAVASLPEAKAAIYYWDTASGTWITGANWSDNAASGGTTGIVPGTGDTAVFNQSSVNGNETVQLNAATSIAGMTFNNTGTTLIASDSATPRTLTLGKAPGSAITSVAANNTINVAATAGPVTIGTAALPVNLVLNGSTGVATQQYWTNYSSNPVNIVGNIVNANNHTTSPNSWDGFFVRQGAFVVDLNGTTGQEYVYTNGASTLLSNTPGTVTGIVESGANTLATASSLTIKNNIPFNGTNYSFIINTPGLQTGIGQLSGFNTMTIDGGSVQVAGGFNVGSAGFGNNTLNVQNGGVFNASRLGAGNFTTNVINVTGAGSTISGITRNNNGGIGAGGTWNITNGGTAVLGANTMVLLSTFNATISGTDPTTGQASVFSFLTGPTLSQSTNASAITCNAYGFYDVVNGQTSGGNANQMKLNTGGGLAFRTSGDAFAQPAWATGALVQWSGSNRLYLSGATDTGSTAYTFTTTLGTKNYLGLVCAGTNTIARQVSFDNANGGNLLFSAPVSTTVTDTFSGGMQTNTGTGGTNQIPVTVMGGTTQLTVTGGIQGTGGINLTSTSNGTLMLMSANTYSGATSINAGTLALGASGSINNSSGIAISGGATYNVSAVGGYALAASQSLSAPGTGTATVTGSLNAGANTVSLQDATNIGTLAFNNDLTLNGGTLRFDLGSGNTADKITIAGTPNLSGSNTINVAALTGLTSLSLGNYTLITAGSNLNTTFTLASATLTVGANTYNLSLTGSTSTAEILTLTFGGGGATNGQYTLATVVTGTTLLHANGGTTTLSTTITNTGTNPQDALTFSALTATAGSGTVGAAGGTTNGGLALAATSTPAATQTYTAGATSGSVAISNSATVTNTTAAGTPAATNTGTSVTVYSGLSIWTGASGGSWGTLSGGFGTNWGATQGSPGVDAGFAMTDTATFGSTAGSVTVNLDGATPSLNAITFNSTGSYTVAQGSGGGLTLAGGGASITAAGTQLISAPVTLAANVAVSVTGASDALSISGAIGETGGAQTLTKTGSGTLTLSGANNYTGATLISTGTLLATNAGSLGTTAAGTTVISGATLDVQANIGTEAISVGGSGVGNNGALITSTGTGTLGGAVTLTADTTFGGSGTLNITGNINASSSRTLTKVGTGVVNIAGGFDASGTPNFDSQVNAQAGTLKLSSSTFNTGLINVTGNGVDAVLRMANSTVFLDGRDIDGALYIGFSGTNTSTATINGGSLTTNWGGIVINHSGNTQKSLLVIENGAVVNLNDTDGPSIFWTGDNTAGTTGSSHVVMRGGSLTSTALPSSVLV